MVKFGGLYECKLKRARVIGKWLEEKLNKLIELNLQSTQARYKQKPSIQQQNLMKWTLENKLTKGKSFPKNFIWLIHKRHITL